MAEIIEGEVITGGQTPPAPEVVDNGGKTAVVKKTDVQPTDSDNRIKLYNEILNLKEQGFSDVYKKIGYKKFDSLLQNDREFQSALLTDLNERGYEISPEDFAFAYTKQSPSMVADFDALPKQAEPPLPEKDEEGLLSQVKGMFKSVYNYTKEPFEDLYKFAKRGFYTGLGGRGAQAENFATGTVDTKNLAEYLKKANDVGTTRIEAEFAKDEGLLKDTDDLLAMLIPSVVESFANMAGAGYKKLLGITAAGAGTGAAIGGLPGAAIGGGRALQGAMLQQGYNLEFVGTVIDELSTKKLINLDSDVNTIEKQLNAAFANKELMKPIFEKANTRAAAITATDFVLSGMGATVARNLAKSKVAGKVMNTKVGQMFSELAEKTVSNPVYRKAARLTNRVAEIDKKIAGSKLGKAGVTVGVQDMFGGAAGETIAQALTQDELDWKSIAVEAGAEGKFINTLRALGKIGEKRISQKAISQFATKKNLPPNQKPPAPEDEFVAVTEEELSNYKKGNVSPERAAGLADDVDIAFKNPTHIEKVKAADSLYGEMLQDAFNKHMAALENQKLRDVALTSTAETYGKTAEEIATIIDPSNPAYNEKIANEVKNAYEVLKQQYKEQTGNDSEDTTRVSGEVGGGAESQQTKSEQGASEEEAGDGGVVQAAADEVRLSDIDEMLADDDNFFKDTGDRLLSPEERQDLEQERVRLTTPAGTTTQQTGVGNAPTQEGTQQTGGVSPQPVPAAVVGDGAGKAVPAGTVAEQSGATPAPGMGEAIPAEEVGDEELVVINKEDPFYTVIWEKGDPVVSRMDAEKRIGDGERLFGFQEMDGSFTEVTNKNLYAFPPDTLVSIPAGVAVTKAEVGGGATTKTKSVGKASGAVKAETKPAITKNDASFRKGKNFDKDGVYEVVAKGKVIGKLSFDKKEKMWVDATGDKFAQKKDAVTKMVLQYNKKGEAAAETTTTKGKGKGKGKAAPTEKTETTPTGKTEEEDIPLVEAEVVEEEAPEETTTIGDEGGVSIIPTLVKSDFERNGDLTDAGFEKATKILKGIIDKVAAKAGLPPKRIYEAFHMTSNGKKYISAAKGIMEVQVTNFKDVITAVKRIAFDAFPGKEDELNEQINKHTEELYDAHLEDRDFERNPALNKILRAINDVNDIWAGTVSKTESLLAKGTGKAETAQAGKTEITGAAMPPSIQQAYARRATLRMTSEALQKQMGGKKLGAKAQKELDTVNAEIAQLDNLLNAFEKEREKQRAAKAKAEPTPEKKETKTEEKPTALVGGTVKGMAYGNYLINQLVSKDPKGEESRQEYIDAWNAINKAQENANKANSFLEDILVGMMPADKKPTAYADIREGFKQQGAVETTTETKGETKPTGKAETAPEVKPTETAEGKPTPSAAPSKAPLFSEFDAISADRGKMKEAKAEFIAKHGQLAYDAMKEISANFTKITKALQEKEILTKKC